METTRRSGVVILLVFAVLVQSQNGNLDCNGRSSLCVGPLIYKTCQDNGNGQMITDDEPTKECPKGSRCDQDGPSSCILIKTTTGTEPDRTNETTTSSNATEADVSNQTSNKPIDSVSEPSFENDNEIRPPEIENEKESNNETSKEPLPEAGENSTEPLIVLPSENDNITTTEQPIIENERPSAIASSPEEKNISQQEPANGVGSVPETSGGSVPSDKPGEYETVVIDESYKESSDDPGEQIPTVSSTTLTTEQTTSDITADQVIPNSTMLNNETSNQETTETSQATSPEDSGDLLELEKSDNRTTAFSTESSTTLVVEEEESISDQTITSGTENSTFDPNLNEEEPSRNVTTDKYGKETPSEQSKLEEPEVVQTPSIITPDEEVRETSESNKNNSYPKQESGSLPGSSTDEASEVFVDNAESSTNTDSSTMYNQELPTPEVSPQASSIEPTDGPLENVRKSSTEGDDIQPTKSESSPTTSVSHNEVSNKPSESPKELPGSIPKTSEPRQPSLVPTGEDGLANNSSQPSDIVETNSLDQVSSGSPSTGKSSGSESSTIPREQTVPIGGASQGEFAGPVPAKATVSSGTESQEPSNVSANITASGEKGGNAGPEDLFSSAGGSESSVQNGDRQGETAISKKTPHEQPISVANNTASAEPSVSLGNEPKQASDAPSNIQIQEKPGDKVDPDEFYPSVNAPESSGSSVGIPQSEVTSDKTSAKQPTEVGTSGIGVDKGSESQQPSYVSPNIQSPGEQGNNVYQEDLYPSAGAVESSAASIGTPQSEDTTSNQTSAKQPTTTLTNAVVAQNGVSVGNEGQQPSNVSQKFQSSGEQSDNAGLEVLYPSVGAAESSVPSSGTPQGAVTTSDQVSAAQPTTAGSGMTGVGLSSESQQPSDVSSNIKSTGEHGDNAVAEDLYVPAGVPQPSVPSTSQGKQTTSDQNFVKQPTPTGTSATGVGGGIENQQPSDISSNTQSVGAPESTVPIAGTPQGEGTISDHDFAKQPNTVETSVNAAKPGVSLGSESQQPSDVSQNNQSRGDQDGKAGPEDLYPSVDGPESSVSSPGTAQSKVPTSDQTSAKQPTIAGTSTTVAKPGISLGSESQHPSDVFPDIQSPGGQADNAGAEDLYPSIDAPESRVPNAGIPQGEETTSNHISVKQPTIAGPSATAAKPGVGFGSESQQPSDVSPISQSQEEKLGVDSSATGLHSATPLRPPASSHLPGQLPTLVSGTSAGIPPVLSINPTSSSETSEEGVESIESVESNESIPSNESASVENKIGGSLVKEDKEAISSESNESLQYVQNKRNRNSSDKENKSVEIDESPESNELPKSAESGENPSLEKNKSESNESRESAESIGSKTNKSKKSKKRPESVESLESAEKKKRAGKGNKSGESSESSESNESKAKDGHRDNSSKSRNSSSSEEHDSKEKEKFECTEEGRFSDPRNCKKYYICSLNEKAKLKKYHLKCHHHHIYDLKKAECIYEHKKCD